MNELELQTLEACHEAVLRQHEMLSFLAANLDVPADDLFYCWMLRRGHFPQHGQMAEDWTYFFHGFECDLHNTKDGRHLRLDFGPKGSVDTLTAWGALQFIMTTTHPWPVYDKLKAQFAKASPPYDEYSGDTDKFYPIWDRLLAEGCFEVADAELLALQEKHTTVGGDGIRVVRYPEGRAPDIWVDGLVAHRKRISVIGRQWLERHRAGAAR